MSNLPPEVVEAMKEEFRRTGRLGGLTRAKNMTPEQRRKSALKASKAAAAARREKAEHDARMKKLEKTASEISKRAANLLKKVKRKKKIA
jgi:hypothetical protein